MLNNNKRKFLFRTSAVLAFTLSGASNKVFAEWQESLFTHKELDAALNSLTNNVAPTQSDEIHIKAPEIAENGAVVPVTVNTNIANVSNISIIVDSNPSPLTSTFSINPSLEAYVSTRVKIAKSTNIIALITTSDNTFFSNSKSIKVTIGGCGG